MRSVIRSVDIYEYTLIQLINLKTHPMMNCKLAAAFRTNRRQH